MERDASGKDVSQELLLLLHGIAVQYGVFDAEPERTLDPFELVRAIESELEHLSRQAVLRGSEIASLRLSEREAVDALHRLSARLIRSEQLVMDRNDELRQKDVKIAEIEGLLRDLRSDLETAYVTNNLLMGKSSRPLKSSHVPMDVASIACDEELAEFQEVEARMSRAGREKPTDPCGRRIPNDQEATRTAQTHPELSRCITIPPPR